MSTRAESGPKPNEAARGDGSGLRMALYGALVLLYLLHNDLWLWHVRRLVLGLPAGLTYHIAYCLATALLMALLVRWAWPEELAAHAESEVSPEP